jgi:hypothetical protein
MNSAVSATSRRDRSQRIVLALFAAATLAMILYVTSFYILSRRGRAIAKTHGWVGYYFEVPTDDASDRRNEFLRSFYRPLVLIDEALGNEGPVR